MAGAAGMSRKIKNALVTILSGIQYGGEVAFVSVLDSTKDAFDGYPAVRVLPNTINSETDSNTERAHMVSYAVLLHLPIEDPDNVETAIYDQMYDLTDLIINTVESADFARQLENIDPTITNFLKMDVGNNQWRVASSKTGGMLFANITVQVTYSRSAA